jgi:hypothetical protein
MKKEETFPASYAGNGNRDSKWWSPSLSLIFSKLEEYSWSLQYWIWWLRWVLKQGGVISPTQITWAIGVLYNFHLLDMSFILFVPPTIQGFLELVTISKRKAEPPGM